MRDWNVVKLRDNVKYTSYAGQYGILIESLKETAVINFRGNCGGICVNVSHCDYHILPSNLWYISDGEIVVKSYDEHIRTGLKIRL